MRSNDLHVEHRVRTVGAIDPEKATNNSVAFKTPNSTVSFIILKWMKFDTTTMLLRAGGPGILSCWDQNPDGHMTSYEVLS